MNNFLVDVKKKGLWVFISIELARIGPARKQSGRPPGRLEGARKAYITLGTQIFFLDEPFLFGRPKKKWFIYIYQDMKVSADFSNCENIRLPGNMFLIYKGKSSNAGNIFSGNMFMIYKGNVSECDKTSF